MIAWHEYIILANNVHTLCQWHKKWSVIRNAHCSLGQWVSGDNSLELTFQWQHQADDANTVNDPTSKHLEFVSCSNVKSFGITRNSFNVIYLLNYVNSKYIN